MKRNDQVRTTKGSTVHPMSLRALEKLGHDISLARRARRMSAEDFASRAGISRATLYRLERGDPGISINTLCMAMHVFGRLQNMADLMDSRSDDVGLMVMRGDVPKRISRPNRVEISDKEENVSPDIMEW